MKEPQCFLAYAFQIQSPWDVTEDGYQSHYLHIYKPCKPCKLVKQRVVYHVENGNNNILTPPLVVHIYLHSSQVYKRDEQMEDSHNEKQSKSNELHISGWDNDN